MLARRFFSFFIVVILLLGGCTPAAERAKRMPVMREKVGTPSAKKPEDFDDNPYWFYPSDTRWEYDLYEDMRGAEWLEPTDELLSLYYNIGHKGIRRSSSLPQLNEPWADEFNRYYQQLFDTERAKAEADYEASREQGDQFQLRRYDVSCSDFYYWRRFCIVTVSYYYSGMRTFKWPRIDVFDTVTGKHLGYDDVFDMGWEEYLLDTVRVNISASTPDQPEMPGILPEQQHLVVTPYGVGFQYAYGELSSMAAGAQRIIIPYEKLWDKLNPFYFHEPLFLEPLVLDGERYIVYMDESNDQRIELLRLQDNELVTVASSESGSYYMIHGEIIQMKGCEHPILVASSFFTGARLYEIRPDGLPLVLAFEKIGGGADVTFLDENKDGVYEAFVGTRLGTDSIPFPVSRTYAYQNGALVMTDEVMAVGEYPDTPEEVLLEYLFLSKFLSDAPIPAGLERLAELSDLGLMENPFASWMSQVYDLRLPLMSDMMDVSMTGHRAQIALFAESAGAGHTDSWYQFTCEATLELQNDRWRLVAADVVPLETIYAQ